MSANRWISGLSPSGQDLNVDVHKRVDAGMAMHILCLTENPWTVLDPTVNLVCRVDDLEILSAAHSRNVDLCKIDVATSCLQSSCLYWNVNLNVNLSCPLLLLCVWGRGGGEGLNAERCGVSAAQGVSTLVELLCSVTSSFSVLQAYERVMGLRRSSKSSLWFIRLDNSLDTMLSMRHLVLTSLHVAQLVPLFVLVTLWPVHAC